MIFNEVLPIIGFKKYLLRGKFGREKIGKGSARAAFAAISWQYQDHEIVWVCLTWLKSHVSVKFHKNGILKKLNHYYVHRERLLNKGNLECYTL